MSTTVTSPLEQPFTGLDVHGWVLVEVEIRKKPRLINHKGRRENTRGEGLFSALCGATPNAKTSSVSGEGS